MTMVPEYIKKLLGQYKERFGDGLALLGFQWGSWADVANIIRDCLRTNKPYQYPDTPQY